MIDRDRVRMLLDAMWNQGDAEALEELYAETYVGHDPQNPLQGRDALMTWWEETLEISPDFHLDIHDVAIDGDMSAMRWTVGGTQTKEWRSIPPTGNAWLITGMTMSKWENDKIVESWTNSDMLGLLQQLEVIPAMSG